MSREYIANACGQNSYCYADCLERVGRRLLKGIGIARDIEKAHIFLSDALHGFYMRGKTAPFAAGLIKNTRKLLDECEKILNGECVG